MIKKNQRWIALTVICAFAWLMHLSTMPCEASAAEQKPGVYEAAKPRPAPAPKKSILPYILIGLGVVAVAAVLFLVVLKTQYDIRGTWSLTRSAEFTWIQNPRTFVFTGASSETGMLSESGYGDNGPWVCEGKKVRFTMTTSGAYQWTFEGEFTDKDALSGTVLYHDSHQDINGTWSATRVAE